MPPLAIRGVTPGAAAVAPSNITGHAAAACEDDGDLPVTPERMIRWRSVNSSQNCHDEGYLHMTKDDGYS